MGAHGPDGKRLHVRPQVATMPSCGAGGAHKALPTAGFAMKPPLELPPFLGERRKKREKGGR